MYYPGTNISGSYKINIVKYGIWRVLMSVKFELNNEADNSSIDGDPTVRY